MLQLSWFWLAMGYAVLMSGFYFLSKKALIKEGVDGTVFGGLLNLTVGLLTLPVALSTGFEFQASVKNVTILLSMGLATTVGIYLFYDGLKKIELSEVTVLESSSVIYSMVLGIILFSESLSWHKVLAALLVIFAIWLVSGLKQINRISGPEWRILLSVLFFSAGAMADKYLVNYANTVTYISLAFLTPGIIVTTLNFRRWAANKAMQTPAFFKSLLAVCLVVAAAYVFMFSAYRVGEISRIYVIGQSQVVLTALLGVIVFHERQNLRYKLLALVFLLPGLYLLRI